MLGKQYQCSQHESTYFTKTCLELLLYCGGIAYVVIICIYAAVHICIAMKRGRKGEENHGAETDDG